MEAKPEDMAQALSTAGRGRKPSALAAATAPELRPEAAAEIETALAEARASATGEQDMSAQQFECARIIGQVQTFELINNFGQTGRLALLKQVKESKAYKGLRVPQPDGSVLTLRTFDDFCTAMGISYSKVAQDLQNLAVFGEAFMESAQKMGIGYRDLRKLRALPEDAREIVIESEAVRSNDPELLKDLLEEVAGKNAALKVQVKEKEADLAAREKVLVTKNQALDEAHTQIEKLRGLSLEDKAAKIAAQQREALKLTAEKAGLALQGMAEFFDALNTALELPELSPHIRGQVEGCVNAVGSTLADMFANDLDWRVDFAGLVYPEWMEARAEAKEADNA